MLHLLLLRVIELCDNALHNLFSLESLLNMQSFRSFTLYQLDIVHNKA